MNRRHATDSREHPSRPNRRRGQTLIFLLMVMVILFFAAMWHFDLHKIIYVKTLSQNAGDAAALAAARWQGRTLNLVGDLNIVQAMALMDGDANSASAIAELQARLCYAGPMIAAMAAQQAAKHNRIHVNPRFTDYLRDHAEVVRNVYPSIFSDDGEMLFPEPFENAWSEYADMIDMLCDHGIAAGPDNMQLYHDVTGGHILLSPDFYNAVNASDWCWFYFNQPGLLENYSGYNYWPPLPEILPVPDPINSEIFGLGLQRWVHFEQLEAVPTMDELRVARALGETVITTNILEFSAVWYAYAPGIWTEWTVFAPGSGFPVVGPVYPVYDVAGADAAVRIEADAQRLTPGAGTDRVTWTAAAKPFGRLNDERADVHGLVLPAFEDVRLIAVNASSAPAGGAFNLAWREHVENHLPLYMEFGPSGLDNNCIYCSALIKWEVPAFRQGGSTWLDQNSASCYTTGGGPGGSPGGGTSTAH